MLLPKAALGQTDADTKLDNLFEEAWQYKLKTNPLEATFIGVHDYDDRLPDASVEAHKNELQKQQIFLDRLQQIDRSTLSEDNKLNYDLFATLKERRINELEHQEYLIPINSFMGFHTYFPQLPDYMPLQTLEGYEDYISRLNAFSRFVQQQISLMEEGLDKGYSLPKVVAGKVPSMVKPHIVEDPQESRLYQPFGEFPEQISESEQKRLRQAGEEAIEASVVPGFEAFHDFLVDTYIPNARDTIAATALPDGENYYQHRIQYHTTLDWSPEKIHEIGKQEVRRIRDEMDAIVDQEGYDSFDQFLEFLRTDDQFYADSQEELLKETSHILKRLDGKLPEFFQTLPRMPYGIKEVPEYQAPNTPMAYYQPPSLDGTRAGFFFINTHDLPNRPLYEIEALAIHEAVPGHHLQKALQVELDDVPRFRRNANFAAFTEGWALYTEWLGKEMGMYEDPYSEFGQLSYEMERALRLVLDTGIHYKGWSRQQAIEYMVEYSGMPESNVKVEVDRFISWPGQALAYKMGELKIKALRERAEQSLGDQFDLREFHDVVLENGSIPLDLLENQIEEYIQDSKR
jgi:uncharacterized protein (DUF885 family)